MAWPFRRKREMPEGLWQVCSGCEQYVYKQQVEEALNCCPLCHEHFPISGYPRVDITADAGSFIEIGADVISRDVLGFVDSKGEYGKKLRQTRKRSRASDACVAGRATIEGIGVIIAALDFSFMGGSMGHAVGEKVALALEAALEHELPCIVFSASGGARMHEGALSLMQMAKTSAAVHRYKARGR